MRSGIVSLVGLTACALPRSTDRNEDGGPRVVDASHEVSVWREIGRSVEARPIRLRTVGVGPTRVLWIGGIHGNEAEGAIATDRLGPQNATVLR